MRCAEWHDQQIAGNNVEHLVAKGHQTDAFQHIDGFCMLSMIVLRHFRAHPNDICGVQAVLIEFLYLDGLKICGFSDLSMGWRNCAFASILNRIQESE